jgi:hypothetical protein
MSTVSGQSNDLNVPAVDGQFFAGSISSPLGRFVTWRATWPTAKLVWLGPSSRPRCCETAAP